MNYIKYLSLPASQKTNRLFTLARRDAFYAQIIIDLESYGHQIQHRYWGQNGSYTPQTIELLEDYNTEKAVQTLHRQGKIQARFTFSSRYGPAQIAHYWLHELTHFWQDLNGLFLTPLIQKDTQTIMLDAHSHIILTCFNEAIAETEALRASWRLKENGDPTAWNGARTSLDWGKHARAYEKDIQTMLEPEAARNTFNRWYTSNQRPHYEKRALNSYQKTLKKISEPRLRTLNLQDFIKTHETTKNLPYLPNLNTPLYTKIHHKKTAQQTEAMETAQNSSPQDIQIASAAYLWKKSTD